MERGFCAECGTPLAWRYLTAEWSDWLGITIGALDDPGAVAPTCHYGIESRLPWLALADDLPEGTYGDRFVEKRAEFGRDNPDGAPSGYRWGEDLER